MGELYQWIGKILLDDDQVYTLVDRSLAFEIAASERIADQWVELQASSAEVVIVSGPVDKTLFYRQILSPACSPGQRAAFVELLASRYKKSWSWINERAATRGEQGGYHASGSAQLFDEFLSKLEQMDPLPVGSKGKSAPSKQELEQAREKASERDAEVVELRQDLDFAEDRASRAHQRLREVEKVENQLRKQLRDAKENGEKLRVERSRRIKLERQANEANRELERLRGEYVKLDQRLQQMARRLAEAEERRASTAIDLSALRRLEVKQVLGVEGPLTGGEIGQIRRQFATVFHSDRVKRLPAWVGRLFDELLGVVNEACDRARK